ncbi:glycosyltransferase [Chitinophaga lutea]
MDANVFPAHYTLLICAYNPDERILRRCLAAVAALRRQGLRTETILADNNSHPAVATLDAVKTYGPLIPGFRILPVPEQGVQFARMAAIEQAKGRYIVYIDYDNEPDAGYLQALEELHRLYPQVAAWGPGHVRVDFLDGVAPGLETYARHLLQERHETTTRFAADPEWQTCYPFGTGLCMETEMLREYVRQAKDGAFSLHGRKGRRLSSGEDTQMVLQAIRNGRFAGVAPELRLRHMIPAERCNLRYLQRLTYGTGVCYDTCLLEVFPSYRERLQQRLLSPAAFTRKSVKQWIRAAWSRKPEQKFELARFLSIHAGIYTALRQPVPPAVAGIIRYLKLE